jgi:hypothetical protein
MATASLRRRAAGWRRRDRRGRQRLSRASLRQVLAAGGWALLLVALAWLVAAGVYGLMSV